MSKLDEKQVEQAHKSAAVQKDKAFEEWVSQSVLDETADMVNGLENDPDLDDFEPSEELLQKIVGIANERGLLAEEEQEDMNVEKIELSDDKESQKNIFAKNSKAIKTIQPFKKSVIYKTSYARKAFKWVAMLAITLMGVFGVSMSSQANRTFVMQKMNQMFGNDVNTKVNNTGDVIVSSTQEEDDKKEIERTLEVTVPSLYYLPDGTIYDSFRIDQDAHAVYMRYKLETQYFYLQILENNNESSGIYRNDQGSLIDTLDNDWIDSKIELWKIEEEGDEMPVYLAQWDYGNTYYCISGKLQEKEIRLIVENLIF